MTVKNNVHDDDNPGVHVCFSVTKYSHLEKNMGVAMHRLIALFSIWVEHLAWQV